MEGEYPWAARGNRELLQGRLNMFQSMLKALAEYAVRKDDPELNIHMLRLGLYEMPATKIDEAIVGELSKIKRGKKEWLTRLSRGV